MASWKLLDLTKLLAIREATLSGNVGAYERPLGAPRPTFPKFDVGIPDPQYAALLGTIKRKKKKQK